MHRVCSFPGCGRAHLARGMCSGHYRQSRKKGVLRPLSAWMRRLTEAERFELKIAPGENGCIIWTGAISPAGYGQFCVDGIQVSAHRWSYQRANGPIPAGKVVDHLCRVPKCVNPSHLEVVSQQENTLRGVGPSAQNARKTHCHRGHEFSEGNTAVYENRRICRTCQRQRGLVVDARRRAVLRAARSEWKARTP